MPAQYTNKPDKYFAGYQGTLFKQKKKENQNLCFMFMTTALN